MTTIRPSYSVFSASDLVAYSELPSTVQREHQARLAEMHHRAAEQAGLAFATADIQPAGDGNLIQWPAGTDIVALVSEFPQRMARALGAANKSLVPARQMRLRLALTAGVSEPGVYGHAGQPPIVVSRLLNSAEARAAQRRQPAAQLVLVLDDFLYDTVVAQEYGGLEPRSFQRVEVREKKLVRAAWITVIDGSGSFHHPAAGTMAKPGSRRRGPAAGPLLVAGIAAATVLAATVPVVATHWPSPGGTSDAGPQVSATPAPGPSAAGPVDPGTSGTSPASTPASGYPEYVANRHGVQTFADNTGATSGRGGIPYATAVQVACWVSNASDMSSINAFYRLVGGRWGGLYAPANVFTNGDRLGTAGTTDLDPHIPQCREV